jgi:hypothetical protein
VKVPLILLIISTQSVPPEPNIFTQFDDDDVQEGRYVDSVPDAFIGLWASDQSDCQNSEAPTRLVIGPHYLQFKQTDGEVKTIVVHHSRAVTVRTAFVRDGHSWTANEKMILDRDLNGLTFGQGRTRFHRIRCRQANDRP